MRCIILISVVYLQLGWSYGEPRGVGAFAYQDTSGKRYGGTYDLDDAQVYQQAGGYGPPFVQSFQNVDDFFPEYFSNFENLLRETFQANLENQKLAITAAKKAYALTSNQADFIPNFDNRFNDFGGFGGFPGFGMRMPTMNGAFASGVAGPGLSHQIAAINPMNPLNPNVNVVNRFSESSSPNGNFYSVSSSSFSQDSNLNGNRKSHRKAETVINNNGKVTAYKVED